MNAVFKALCLAVLPGLALVSNARAEPLPREEAPPYSVELSIALGSARAPYFTPEFPQVRGHGIVGLLQVGFVLRPQHSLGLAAPLLGISVEQPAGSYRDTFSWGNLNLLYSYHRVLFEGAVRVVLDTGAALALPIATRSESTLLLSGRALRLGSALDGLRNPELYTEGVLPIAGRLGVALQRRWLVAEAGVRVPVLLRFSDAHLPESAPNAVGIMSVLHVGLAADATRWLTLSLAADTLVDVIPSARTPRDAPSAQLTLEPAVQFRLPHRLLLGSTFIAPLGGALGGSTFAGRVSLRYER